MPTEKELLKNHKTMLEIENKVNDYLIEALKQFIFSKLPEIKYEAKQNDLIYTHVLNLFLDKIKMIDFKGAYADLSRGRKDSVLKYKPNSTELDPESLDNLIAKEIGYTEDHRQKKQSFISLLIDNNKDQLTGKNKDNKDPLTYKARDRWAISTLKEIKVIINSYSKKNKKSILKEINQEIDDVMQQNQEDNSDADVVNKMQGIFQRTQNKENEYYRKCFLYILFGASMQKHSTFQQNINKGQEVLAKFKGAK